MWNSTKWRAHSALFSFCGLLLISSHTLFAAVVKRDPFDLKSELHSFLKKSIRKCRQEKMFHLILSSVNNKKRVFKETKVNSSQISGLSLRGGCRGFPTDTMNVAPGYFHSSRKIESKEIPSWLISRLLQCLDIRWNTVSCLTSPNTRRLGTGEKKSTQGGAGGNRREKRRGIRFQSLW